jgi:hypothetical protein
MAEGEGGVRHTHELDGCVRFYPIVTPYEPPSTRIPKVPALPACLPCLPDVDRDHVFGEWCRLRRERGGNVGLDAMLLDTWLTPA